MKKALRIIKNVLIWTIVIFAVLMTIFTIISVNTFNRNDRQILGFKLYIVESDSMSATDFSAGDLIAVKETDPNTLKEGDIITYISQSRESFGETITHKIRKKTTDARGNPGFITYGTTTGQDDDTVVTYMYILGKYEGKIPGMGYFFNFMKTPAGYIICIFVPFMMLIIYQGIRSFLLFRTYKRQQLEDMQTERDELETEKEKNAQMKAELEALKAKLGETAASDSQPESSSDDKKSDDPKSDDAASESGKPQAPADPPAESDSSEQ